jgi:hypothetical protein
MKKALLIAGFLVFCLLIAAKLGFDKWEISYKILYVAVVGIVSFILYTTLFSRRVSKITTPLTTGDVKRKAGEVRENNHPGHFTLCNLVKLECIANFSDAGKPVKNGQIVHARQVCERGRWHDCVRLRGGSYWIPVEYFKLTK